MRLIRGTISHVTVNKSVCKSCIIDCTYQGIHHEVVRYGCSGDWPSNASPGEFELILNVLQYIIVARVGAQRVRNVRVVDPEWLSRLATGDQDKDR